MTKTQYSLALETSLRIVKKRERTRAKDTTIIVLVHVNRKALYEKGKVVVQPALNPYSKVDYLAESRGKKRDFTTRKTIANAVTIRLIVRKYLGQFRNMRDRIFATVFRYSKR